MRSTDQEDTMIDFHLPPYTEPTTAVAEIDHAAWDDARRRYFDRFLRPTLTAVFDQHLWMSSAAICVAQYWDDEADDAVHAEVIFSRFDTPDVAGALSEGWDPNLPEGDGQRVVDGHWDLLMRRADGSRRWGWDGGGDDWAWDNNGCAISLFASYCNADGDQCAPAVDSFATWAVVRRAPDGLALHVVGDRVRPWLDGVRPSWECEPGGETW
jgi:hypothetical protein